MKKEEIIYAVILGTGILIFEFANVNGFGLCFFLPVVYGIVFLGIKFLPKNE
jgi:hypothetical protein